MLELARGYGFLGPGPVEPHIERSLHFASAVPPAATALDLGSGGGVPGLIMALVWPSCRFVFLDAMAKRCAFLRSLTSNPFLAGRVDVVEGRAEELGHRPKLREAFEVVTARSFGAPAVMAECAAGFVRVGGSVLVSEPPDLRPWPADALMKLGLEFGSRTVDNVALLRKVHTCPENYPRRNGRPSKAPLF
jgi:16S rRNA (guanine527-N7)-methyltransferase